jgi:hypothetical protein
MLKIIAILGITFLSLFAFAFLAPSTTHAVTPEAPTAGVEEAFHLKYRQQDISSDGVTHSGVLILNVYNTSGEDAQDIVAMIPGPNSVTYDNHPIYVGTVVDGQQVEILDRFVVPQELIDPNITDDDVIWQLEFTNALGSRITQDVVGRKAE